MSSPQLLHVQARSPVQSSNLQIADKEFQRYLGIWKDNQTALGFFCEMIVDSRGDCVRGLKAEVWKRKTALTRIQQLGLIGSPLRTDYDSVAQHGLIKWVLGKGYVLIPLPDNEPTPWKFLGSRLEYVAVEFAIIRYGYVLTDWIEKMKDKHHAFRTACQIGKPVLRGLVSVFGGAGSGTLAPTGEMGHAVELGLESVPSAAEALGRKSTQHKVDAGAMFAHRATRPGNEKEFAQRDLFDEDGLRASFALVPQDDQTAIDKTVAFHTALVYNIVLMKFDGNPPKVRVPQKTVTGIRTFNYEKGWYHFENYFPKANEARKVLGQLPYRDLHYFNDYGMQWEREQGVLTTRIQGNVGDSEHNGLKTYLWEQCMKTPTFQFV